VPLDVIRIQPNPVRRSFGPATFLAPHGEVPCGNQGAVHVRLGLQISSRLECQWGETLGGDGCQPVRQRRGAMVGAGGDVGSWNALFRDPDPTTCPVSRVIVQVNCSGESAKLKYDFRSRGQLTMHRRDSALETSAVAVILRLLTTAVVPSNEASTPELSRRRL